MDLTYGHIADHFQAGTKTASNSAQQAGQGACSNCSHQLLAKAKYCGECGKTVSVKKLESTEVKRQSAPSFAEVHTHQVTEAPQELRDELDKLFAFLTRERFFLCFHYLVFVSMSMFGFCLSLKTYTEFNADEVSKMVIAAVPFAVINLLALLCFSPIRGTKIEIARLKERITYVRYKIEYWGLI
jgi:DNA-directed RNA polymerase subunit RPC12/RpoP